MQEVDNTDRQQEIILRASKQARAGETRDLVVHGEGTRAEPLNADGTPMFEPTFHPWMDWPKIEQECNTVLSAPQCESLSGPEWDRE